jgi:hypothetical protein
MSSFLEISPEKFNRLVGTPGAPLIIDVRTPEDLSCYRNRLRRHPWRQGSWPIPPLCIEGGFILPMPWKMGPARSIPGRASRTGMKGQDGSP